MEAHDTVIASDHLYPALRGDHAERDAGQSHRHLRHPVQEHGTARADRVHRVPGVQ